MSTPSLPPRPQRNTPSSALKSDAPLVPPRPLRKTDPSPDREASTRSPLNAPPVALGSRAAPRRTSQDLPRRPPSVTLPTLGGEGDEYSSFDQLPDEAHGVSVDKDGGRTRNVASDLPMHQPRASVPQSTATKNIAGITGTDSTQAAAAGIGRARPADDVHKLPRGDASPTRPSRVTANTKRAPSTEPPSTLHTKASFNRSPSSLLPLERTTSRTGSLHGESDVEHGIPEIGQQIPLNKFAGDAQAPTPGGGQSAHAPGIGFFNDGSSRAHHRKRSSRHEFGPPDSYGIRHDQDHQDQFEKEWIKKHPAEAAKEGYYLHLPKPETALSSEQLNRLVHQSENSALATPGTPAEEDAYEEISSRIASPNTALSERKKRSSSASDHPQSSFHKTGFPISEKHRLRPDDALDPEGSPRRSRYHVDSEDEHSHLDGTPILAADELLKRPSSAFMQPAVVPEPHADDDYYDSDHGHTGSRRGSNHGHSRPSSRPGSVHGNAQSYTGGSLHRFISHEETHHSGVGTPLEEIEEYEPLFPDEEAGPKKQKPRAVKNRPDLAAMHHFPSQDVWEDTPSSLQYMAEVSTPDLEREQPALPAEQSTAATFETPEEEQKRRNPPDSDMTSDAKTFVKPHFKPGVLEEIHRPTAHRFPSSDVWEDTPSSMLSVATVSTPEIEEDRPAVPSRPEREAKLADEAQAEEVSPTQTRSPSISKSKPSIPARPARSSKSEQQSDGAAGEQSRSRGSDEGVTPPPVPKNKPTVPARPGSKIAALQGGFMSDLNNRLKLGPQAVPKKEEPEVGEETQREPLVDARKSRAKGPPRRKPAAAPAVDRKSSATFTMSPLISVWTIDEADELQVQNESENENKNAGPPVPEEAEAAEEAIEANESINTHAAAPAEEVAVAVSRARKPSETAQEHPASAEGLRAALAAAGAGPAAYKNDETAPLPTAQEGANEGLSKEESTSPKAQEPLGADPSGDDGVVADQVKDEPSASS